MAQENVSISRRLAEARTPTQRSQATRLMNDYIKVRLQERETQLRAAFLSNAARIRNQNKTTTTTRSNVSTTRSRRTSSR